MRLPPRLTSSRTRAEGPNGRGVFGRCCYTICRYEVYQGTLDRELKNGSAELLILSLVETRPRHGYEIAKLIEQRSEGKLRFKVASLYPLLYRLEQRGWIAGRWIEKPGERRRRFYRLTADGKRVLAAQRDHWREFVHAIARITGAEHA
jgi:PadR family transcriptional regulator PadR